MEDEGSWEKAAGEEGGSWGSQSQGEQNISHQTFRKDSMKIRNQTRWGGAVKRERVTRWRSWVSSMDQKRSRETTYECCSYWNGGGPLWHGQREAFKSSNELDWIHCLCWALFSSAMCNVWENRPIFKTLMMKLPMLATEVTRWVNWFRDNHCPALTEQVIVVEQTWCKSKHFKTFQRSQFLFLWNAIQHFVG